MFYFFQALNFTVRLEESEQSFKNQQKEISELEELLMKKDSTSKEAIQRFIYILNRFRNKL